jgi:hypothetical protein
MISGCLAVRNRKLWRFHVKTDDLCSRNTAKDAPRRGEGVSARQGHERLTRGRVGRAGLLGDDRAERGVRAQAQRHARCLAARLVAEAARSRAESRGQGVVRRLRGRARVVLSTEQIMALTRGEP